jgi:hypothetical protein
MFSSAVSSSVKMLVSSDQWVTLPWSLMPSGLAAECLRLILRCHEATWPPGPAC